MDNRLFLLAWIGIVLLSMNGCEQKLSAGFTVGMRAPSLPTKTLADAGGN